MSENLVQYVVAAGNGDTQAMGMLYAKTLKSSYFLASKLCGSDAGAVEIAKKAYARAFCSIEKLKKPEAFEIWLKQIIASIYKDGEKFIFSDADGNAQEPSGDFLPEAVLEDSEKAARISEAVDKLTPERRAAVIFHYNNGMPVNALSKFLGVSESTANAVLSKAREDILAFSGVEAASAPEFAALPVLTRLFADMTAKTGVDNDAVRDIFAFAVDAYKAAKEAEEKAEAEEAQTVVSAEETAAEDAEDTAEDTAEEASADESQTDEKADGDSAEDAAEDAEEASAEESDDTADEAADEKNIEAEIDEEKAQMEENILSFKNKISSMLGIDTEEKTEAEDSAEEAEDGAADESEKAEDTDDSDDTASDASADEAAEDDSSDEYSVDDDAFDRIRRSVEGLDTVTEISDEDISADAGAISFADFGGEAADVQISEEAKTEEKPEVKPETIPAKKPEKKAAKVNPKIVIIAIAVLAVIVIAVALLVKGGSKDNDTPTTTAPVSDTVKAPVKWTALPELSEYKEIEFLNEKFNSFKDPDTGKYGLIDYLGNVVLAPEYDGFRRCSNGRYYGEGRLDESGYHVLALKGGQAYEVVMMTDTATVSNEPHAEHAYINNSSMSGGDYDERDRYYEGYAAVRKDGKWGYVAQNSGKLVVPYEFEPVNEVPADDPSQAYDYCRGSSNGYVVVKKGGKMGIIKIEKDAYKVVAELTYDMICQGKGGVFLAYNGTEWGTITVGTDSVQGGVQDEVTTLPPAITDPAEISIGKYVVNDDETNIRTSPDTENDDNIITALSKGFEINALEKKEGSNGSEWIRFEYEGKQAWVSSKKLDKAE